MSVSMLLKTEMSFPFTWEVKVNFLICTNKSHILWMTVAYCLFMTYKHFLSSSDNSYLNTINIIGTPFSYPYKAELMDLLYSIPVKKNFYLTASTACRFIKEIQQIDLPNYELYIYYEQEEASIHHILTEKQIPFHWIYLISSEKQYEDLEKLETKYGNEYVEVHLIYTGDNLPFFEENVYLAEEDILQSNYDKQDIFAHQVMNTNFWGRLFCIT